jgi:copper(I)-binding protein
MSPVKGRGMAIQRRLALLAALGLVAACGPSPESTEPDIQLGSAWARETALGQDTGGVFLTIRNRGGADDRLVGGSSPEARSVEIHTMTLDGSVMRMRRQEAVAIPAGESVELAPGGTHLMLVGLKAPLNQGKTIPVSLDFDKARRIKANVRVREVGSTGPRGDDNE